MKNGAVVSFPIPSEACPICGKESVTTHFEQLEFDYGRPPDQVRLTARVPVHRCAECEFSFTGGDAETLTHDAVCRHLGVMTPREVKRVRERLRLSRAEFAKLTHFGEASLARWESGALIQNGANDQLLFLLQHDDNLSRLRKRGQEGLTQEVILQGETAPMGRVVPIFRALKDQEAVRKNAAYFKL